MRIRRFVSNAGRYILNRGFGVMTERQIKYATLSVGCNVRRARKNGEEIKESIIKKLIDKFLPKGINRPKVLATVDEVEKFSVNETYLSKETIDLFVKEKEISGFCVASTKGNSSALYVKVPNEEIIAHELRHALDYDCTVRSKIMKIIQKIIPQSMLKKILNKYQKKAINLYRITQTEASLASFGRKGEKITEIFNVKYEDLQNFLKSLIRQNLSEKNYKENIKILREVCKAVRGEIRAYNAGGKVARNQRSINVAVYQKEILKVMLIELKQEISNMVKALFGFKVPVVDKASVARPFELFPIKWREVETRELSQEEIAVILKKNVGKLRIL